VFVGRYCGDVICCCGTVLLSGGDLWMVLWCIDMLLQYSVLSGGDLWTLLW
jgi:hypothetical protein